MISLIHACGKSFPKFSVMGISKASMVFALPLFFLFNAMALPAYDTLAPVSDGSSETDYVNYASTEENYENETSFSTTPRWHYYDVFGNKILDDGYYIYGLTMDRNTQLTGVSNIALHAFLKKWLYGLVEVTDLRENSGIMAIMGDRIKTEFTPFTLQQSLLAGTRLDAFYKDNFLSVLTNRISYSGYYGMYATEYRLTPAADWLTGVHGMRKIGGIASIGATFVNIHHEDSTKLGNPFSGIDGDTSAKTPTGLSLYGLNANLTHLKLQANGEFLSSQEFLDGSFKPKPGIVATLNGRYDIREKWKCGGEFYAIGSRYKTTFFCPNHPIGDQFGQLENYQYALVEDNDDNDEYPENGRTKYDQSVYPKGDPDGVISLTYDKDKNGVFDYKEDFLCYDADPPNSKILFDRNSNGVPDVVEDDPYPDYPYIPSYYLPGEQYNRYDDMDKKWEDKAADSLTHKGLAGMHLFSRYDIFKNLHVLAGGIFDRSLEKSYQTTYDAQGAAIGDTLASENALNLYLLAHYTKDIARDYSLIIDNFFRRVTDNIPNHTLRFRLPRDSITQYSLIKDKLEYRDMVTNALRAEFSLIRNRGFNYASVAKLEFQKHFPHLEFNYPNENISSLILINKCEYIYLLPFFKDLFLIPQYKNIYEYGGYGPTTSDSLDVNYRRNSMLNTANLICKWRCSVRSAITTGIHLNRFDDFFDNNENYYKPSFSVQLLLKDRYKGYAIALTTGFSLYAYLYEHPGKYKSLHAHQIFIKAYCGFM
jgi:hypothetical protein